MHCAGRLRLVEIATEPEATRRSAREERRRRGEPESALEARASLADVATHLVDEVLPEVPVRQWVCTLPWALRKLAGYKRVLCKEIIEAFVAPLTTELRPSSGSSATNDADEGSP